MTYPIAHVVGPTRAPEFQALRLRTTERLLARGASPKGRIALMVKLGLTHGRVLDYVNACDLLRIKGLGAKYIPLLRAAGVVTVRELRYRNVENLRHALALANVNEKLVDFLPPEALVARWIEHAKQLPMLVRYR